MRDCSISPKSGSRLANAGHASTSDLAETARSPGYCAPPLGSREPHTAPETHRGLRQQHMRSLPVTMRQEPAFVCSFSGSGGCWEGGLGGKEREGARPSLLRSRGGGAADHPTTQPKPVGESNWAQERGVEEGKLPRLLAPTDSVETIGCDGNEKLCANPRRLESASSRPQRCRVEVPPAKQWDSLGLQ